MKLLERKPGRSSSAKTMRVVLYIEDNPANRDVMELRFEGKYEILFAATDREACEILKKRGHQIEIILVDIELQNSLLDGLKLIKLIRGELPRESLPPYARDIPILSAPVIVVSAYSDAYISSDRDIKELGANELIKKPINFVQLEGAMTRYYVSRILERRSNRSGGIKK